MTSGARPDFGDRTDLIAQAHTHDARQSPAGPGKLCTYLGIAPGVGKTYAMLRDARARRRSGTDTVVAHWERHCRANSASQISPPSASSRSCGSMTQFPMRSRRSPPPAASAGR